MIKYDESDYKNSLRSISTPAALWAQLQEIEKYRTALRNEFLSLSNNDQMRDKILHLLNEYERLIVRWHRMFLDSVAGVEALSKSKIADVLRTEITTYE